MNTGDFKKIRTPLDLHIKKMRIFFLLWYSETIFHLVLIFFPSTIGKNWKVEIMGKTSMKTLLSNHPAIPLTKMKIFYVQY